MNILQLATFPLSAPRHGGQHRASQVALAYRQAGHRVTSAGVLASPGWDAEPGYLGYAEATGASHEGGTPQLEEMRIGQRCASDDATYRLLCARIAAVGVSVPDLVQVEHPWLAAFARRYIAEHAPLARLVYSAHNVEHAMKFAILRGELGAAAAQVAQARVAQCELDAIRSADGIICVSQDDLDWVRRFSAAPAVLAPNGVAARVASDEDLLAAAALAGQGRFALFAASAHPPNMEGFFALFGAGLGAIAPDQHLVIAGSAGPAIAADARSAAMTGFARCCRIAGLVEEGALAGLLAATHAIVLPITQGGGTNLKTAEALWNGRHVVATSVAMRGFEAFAGAPGVRIADTPAEFGAALRRVMAAPPLRIDKEERERRRAVLWERTLAPLHDLLAALAAQERAA